MQEVLTHSDTFNVEPWRGAPTGSLAATLRQRLPTLALQTNPALDVLTLALAVGVCVATTGSSAAIVHQAGLPLSALLASTFAALATSLLAVSGLYAERRPAWTHSAHALLTSVATATAIVIALSELLGLTDQIRLLFVLAGLLGLSAVGLVHGTVHLSHTVARANGQIFERVILVGDREQLRLLEPRLNEPG